MCFGLLFLKDKHMVKKMKGSIGFNHSVFQWRWLCKMHLLFSHCRQSPVMVTADITGVRCTVSTSIEDNTEDEEYIIVWDLRSLRCMVNS